MFNPANSDLVVLNTLHSFELKTISHGFAHRFIIIIIIIIIVIIIIIIILLLLLFFFISNVVWNFQWWLILVKVYTAFMFRVVMET